MQSLPIAVIQLKGRFARMIQMVIVEYECNLFRRISIAFQNRIGRILVRDGYI